MWLRVVVMPYSAKKKKEGKEKKAAISVIAHTEVVRNREIGGGGVKREQGTSRAHTERRRPFNGRPESGEKRKRSGGGTRKKPPGGGGIKHLTAEGRKPRYNGHGKGK